MKSLKQNNKGFSLIELIVTIAILALVVVPFLRTFFLAMDLDVDAKHVQNASVVAQDVMEVFKAKDLDELLEYSRDVMGVEASVSYTDAATDEFGRTYPIYEFKNWPMKGADGEEFYATITVDSSPYLVDADDDDDADRSPVNSLTSPQFSSLFGSEAIMLLKQYTKPDNEIKGYFKVAYSMSDAEVANITPGNVKKDTTIKVNCQYDPSQGYIYLIILDMTYTTNDGKTVTVSKDVTKIYSTAEGHAIYMMAPVYDTVSTGMANGTIGYYASDKINIEYSYTGTGTAPEVGFYLAEQETKHTTYTMQYAKLNSDNVDISIKNNYGTTTKNLYNYDNSLNNFKVYTNVQKRSGATSTVNVQNLTYSEMSDNTLMYAVTIDIRYGSETGDVITTYTGSNAYKSDEED